MFFTKSKLIRRVTEIQVCLSQHDGKIVPVIIRYVLRA